MEGNMSIRCLLHLLFHLNFLASLIAGKHHVTDNGDSYWESDAEDISTARSLPEIVRKARALPLEAYDNDTSTTAWNLTKPETTVWITKTPNTDSSVADASVKQDTTISMSISTPKGPETTGSISTATSAAPLTRASVKQDTTISVSISTLNGSETTGSTSAVSSAAPLTGASVKQDTTIPVSIPTLNASETTGSTSAVSSAAPLTGASVKQITTISVSISTLNGSDLTRSTSAVSSAAPLTEASVNTISVVISSTSGSETTASTFTGSTTSQPTTTKSIGQEIKERLENGDPAAIVILSLAILSVLALAVGIGVCLKKRRLKKRSTTLFDDAYRFEDKSFEIHHEHVGTSFENYQVAEDYDFESGVLQMQNLSANEDSRQTDISQ